MLFHSSLLLSPYHTTLFSNFLLHHFSPTASEISHVIFLYMNSLPSAKVLGLYEHLKGSGGLKYLNVRSKNIILTHAIQSRKGKWKEVFEEVRRLFIG
jgi:hypothetical protein